jgi:hypothetical protein
MRMRLQQDQIGLVEQVEEILLSVAPQPVVAVHQTS